MVTVSCSGKFHAFALAEQLEKAGMLEQFYTSYAYQKNKITRQFTRRKDLEVIPPSKIMTKPWLAIMFKLFQEEAYRWNSVYDAWVAEAIKRSEGRVFIGWSGMSLNSMKAARGKQMFTILERGSSHIQYQQEILSWEYASLGKSFRIDPALIRKELEEYAYCDMISIPSDFVRRSFLQFGVSADKLFVNPYGAGKLFTATNLNRNQDKKFSIVYLGRLNIRKGLIYLFKALHKLTIPEAAFSVHFIGSTDKEFREYVQKWKKPNWVFHGHVDHYKLPGLLEGMDVGVQPSLEEGLSMVIPQMMSCGVPVIASTNTGGEDIIEEGKTGFIVPVRSPDHIQAALMKFFHNPGLAEQMGTAARTAVQKRFSWDDYGARYIHLLKGILRL